MGVLLAAIVVGIMAVDFDVGDCSDEPRTDCSNIFEHVIEHAEAVLDLDGWDIENSGKVSAMTASEIREVVEAHNKRRRMEKAADMEVMNWSPILASMAEDWVRRCTFDNGQPQRDPDTVPYSWVGQNLYAQTSVSKINLTAVTHLWWNGQKDFYDYDNQRCHAGKTCGHYTQIVWSKSRDIGCAYAVCSKLRGLSKNGVFVVCNYGPGSSLNDEKPYQKGIPCSKCETGSQWCNQGLCDRSCVKSGPKCECSPRCLNSGIADRKTCSCSCPSGWYGTDCSEASA